MLIYVPFNDADLIYGAERMTARDGETYFHGADGPSLRDLAPGATLYLMAHGRYSRGDQICGEVPGRITGTRYVYLTAAQLAKQLTKDGLPKNFGDLRLMVCWGGYMGGNQTWGTHTLQRKATEAPFAGQLCSAMKPTFKRIMVTGYTGEVLFPKRGSTVTPQGIWIENPAGQEIRTTDTGGVAPRFTESTTAAGDKPRTVGTLDNANRTVWH
jgi:hypothetical protein